MAPKKLSFPVRGFHFHSFCGRWNRLHTVYEDKQPADEQRNLITLNIQCTLVLFFELIQALLYRNHDLQQHNDNDNVLPFVYFLSCCSDSSAVFTTISECLWVIYSKTAIHMNLSRRLSAILLCNQLPVVTEWTLRCSWQISVSVLEGIKRNVEKFKFSFDQLNKTRKMYTQLL